MAEPDRVGHFWLHPSCWGVSSASLVAFQESELSEPGVQTACVLSGRPLQSHRNCSSNSHTTPGASEGGCRCCVRAHGTPSHPTQARLVTRRKRSRELVKTAPPRRRNPGALLVGMHSAECPVENSRELPQSVKNRTTLGSSDPTVVENPPRCSGAEICKLEREFGEKEER